MTEPNYKALYTELKGEVLEKVGPFVKVAQPINGEAGRPSPLELITKETEELAVTSIFDTGGRGAVLWADDFRALSTLYDKLSSDVFPESPSGDVKNAAGEAGGSGSWRDIDSAPRDGTAILVFAPGRSDRWEGGLGDLICRCAWHPEAGFCVCELREPTHWQPLPPPPNPSARGEL